jgi:Ca2+-binding RTX toxin-like protein
VTATDLFAATANDVFDIVIGSASETTIPWTPGSVYPLDPAVEKWKSRSGHVINGMLRSDTIYVGGAGYDVLVGTSGNDAILLQDPWNPWTAPTSNPRLVGIERVNGGDGNDVIDMFSHLFAGPPMTLDGGAGNDSISGSTSATVMYGGTGDDFIEGHANDDVIDGGEDGDFMAGGAGNDTYYADDGDDRVYDAAGGGIDTIYSSASFSLSGVSEIEYLVLTGTADNDAYGNSFANTITGNSGDNYIVSGGGADTLIGGAGDDIYFLEDTASEIVELANGGIDSVQSTVSYTLDAGVENLELKAWDTINGSGNELDNFILGNTVSNTLEGFAGNDTLDGGQWGDNDVLIGGTGDDTYHVDSTGDVVIENAGEGFDIVYSDRTGDLAANVEVLFMTGYRDINSNGNALSNLMRGTMDENVLTGGGGIDVLEGAQGWDTLSDTAGDANGLLNGGRGDDALAGSDARELFVGGEDWDTITTGAGADVILFNRYDGRDTVAASIGLDNVVSLGRGIEYDDIALRISGNDLILQTGGGGEGLVFAGWYTDTANRSVDTLQIIIGETADYQPGSSHPMHNQRVQVFDFDGLVAAFDAARATNPALTQWEVGSALASFHVSSSDTAAYGGDLAYLYGTGGSMSDISFAAAAGILGATGFGTALQTLQGPSQDNTPRLS